MVDQIRVERDRDRPEFAPTKVDQPMQLQVIDHQYVAGRELDHAVAHAEAACAGERDEPLQPLVPVHGISAADWREAPELDR